MLKIIKYPERNEWQTLLKRPYVDNSKVIGDVQMILTAVKKEGDAAVKRYSEQFDKVRMKVTEVTLSALKEAENILSDELKTAIKIAAKNIETFHGAQLLREEVVETMPGVQCWRRSIGIEKVGLYIPGGSAPLFSTVLMLAIPARLAGCKEVILCTPARKDGSIHPAILFAARLTGIHRVFAIGGAQAIAAMAYGTESVPAVDKIFGPGNQYVTAAKQLVQMHGTAIDMPAGPSEVCVLADDTANAAFVAADLLSQAEHGVDSQVLLVTPSETLTTSVNCEVIVQLEKLSRKDVAAKALMNSKAIIVRNLEEGIQLVNAYAAEHLIICCTDSDKVAEGVVNAGSVFLGNFTPESVGDYASGTNHTLPTNGFARGYSGVSVDSFVRKVTFQKLTKEGLAALSGTVITMAEAEGLDAHAGSVQIRLGNIT